MHCWTHCLSSSGGHRSGLCVLGAGRGAGLRGPHCQTPEARPSSRGRRFTDLAQRYGWKFAYNSWASPCSWRKHQFPFQGPRKSFGQALRLVLPGEDTPRAAKQREQGSGALLSSEEQPIALDLQSWARCRPTGEACPVPAGLWAG